MRAALLLGFVLLPGGWIMSARASAADPASRLNVLFLFADDQRADTIAGLGNPHIRTQHLDRLAQRGVAFERAYMQGGMQGATCVPSRAMLLSGQSLFRIDEKLLRDPTWPAAFGRAGYTTFFTGKWHNGPAGVAQSFQQAPQVYLGGMVHPLQAKLCQLGPRGLSTPQKVDRHTCAVFADEAVRFLGAHRGSPFFCYVAFNAPHDPHVVPADFPIRYDPEQLPLPPNFLPRHPFDNGDMVLRDEKLLPWPRTPERVRGMLADYYRYVSYLDAQVGRILDALAESPHANNTLIVFAADSGVARGSHGLIGKQNLYEHSLRVPLIVAGPGIPAHERAPGMCYLFDVLPTLGGLCGVPAPAGSEGIDFQATLRDPRRPIRSEMLFAYRHVQRAYRDDHWKLIRYPQVDRTQLFDLRADPQETRDLADRPEQAERIALMRRRLEAEQARWQDRQSWNVANPKPAAWTPPREAPDSGPPHE